MTEWMPKLEEGDGPLYMTLAEALLTDIVSGALEPGTRLPNHRELAAALGTSVGTVTRAYRVAESRGAIDSTPGRGTFVRKSRTGESVVGSTLSLDPGLVDLSVAHPVYSQDPDLQAALVEVSSGVNVQSLLRYQPLSENARFRAAGMEWLGQCGVPDEEGGLVISAGAQNAGLALTLALTEPGDLILADEITYPGFLAMAEQTHRRVRGVPMDEEGMIPEALGEVCQREDPRALYLIPTLHNPTGMVIPERRREVLAAVAQDHDLFVLEDDTLRRLAPDPPPTVTSLIPDRSFFIGTLSKALCGGVRVAYISTPSRFEPAIQAAVGASLFMPSPLLVEIATRWLEDGTASDTLRRKRREMEARHAMAREILGEGRVHSDPQSLYFWLSLPEGWRSPEFEGEARRRSVGVTPSRPFSVNAAHPPEGVRICLSAAETREGLERALGTLAHLLDNPGSRTPGLV